MADCEAAKALLEHLPPIVRILHGDKGYDIHSVLKQVAAKGTWLNIPPKTNWV